MEVFSSSDDLHWRLDSIIEITDGSDISLSHQNSRWQIKEDLYPLDDIFTWLPQVSFQIKQLSPRSSDSTTEWFLFHNPDHIQGLSIIQGEKQYPLIDSSLSQTSNFCVYAQDLSLFEEEFGKLRLCQVELDPWPTLKNSGDTLCVALEGDLIEASCIHWSHTDSIWVNSQQSNSLNEFHILSLPRIQENNSPKIHLSHFYWQLSSPPQFNLKNIQANQEVQVQLFDLQGRPHLETTILGIDFIESFPQLIPFGLRQHFLLEFKLDSTRFQYKIYVE